MEAGAPHTEDSTGSTGASSKITPHAPTESTKKLFNRVAILQKEWNTGGTHAIEAKKARISELEKWFNANSLRPRFYNDVGTQEKN